MAVRWRIYYADGSTYGGNGEDPFLAPTVGVQVLAVEDDRAERGFTLTHGKDAYYWDSKADWWNGCDTPGMWDYLIGFKGPKHLIFGRTVRNDDFWTIVKRAGREGVG